MLRKKLVTYVNTFFFLFAGLAALWLVVLAVVDTRGLQWEIAVYAVAAWAVIAYVFLPRLYKLMTAVFLPDYFIGRARTSSGLLGDVVVPELATTCDVASRSLPRPRAPKLR